MRLCDVARYKKIYGAIPGPWDAAPPKTDAELQPEARQKEQIAKLFEGRIAELRRASNSRWADEL